MPLDAEDVVVPRRRVDRHWKERELTLQQVVVSARLRLGYPERILDQVARDDHERRLDRIDQGAQSPGPFDVPLADVGVGRVHEGE